MGRFSVVLRRMKDGVREDACPAVVSVLGAVHGWGGRTPCRAHDLVTTNKHDSCKSLDCTLHDCM